MDYEELENFIHKKMRMTHIYQPVMLKTLLESKNNTATTEEIARKILNYDDSQLEYYKKIVKRWPHDTLVRKRKIVGYGKEVYKLLLDDMSAQQRQRLKELCDLRLQEFVDKDPWIKKFRELDQRAVSGSIRSDILSKSGGVCVACGKPATEVAIDIDHIVPRSLGGKTEPGNLQALCFQCNREKRNRNEIDFLKIQKRLQFRHDKCALCNGTNIIRSNHLVCAMKAKEPVSDMHSLIMPKRHVGTFVDLIPAERQLCMDLVDEVIHDIKSRTSFERFDISGSDKSVNGHYYINIVPRM